jgi:plasmid stability protein
MKEQIATRLEASLRRRLRVYAAAHGRTVAEVVSTALDGYLPPLAEIIPVDTAPATSEVNALLGVTHTSALWRSGPPRALPTPTAALDHLPSQPDGDPVKTVTDLGSVR